MTTLQVNPGKPIDFTTYGEALHHAVKDLGTATPHHQTIRLLAWLFSSPIGLVRADCQATWLRLQSQNRGGG